MTDCNFQAAVFIHDTRRVISANNAACMMFRSQRIALVDIDMLELIASEDMRGLAALRMRVLREGHGPPLPNIQYPFLRGDGTVFWGSTKTRMLRDGTYETTVTYEFEK